LRCPISFFRLLRSVIPFYQRHTAFRTACFGAGRDPTHFDFLGRSTGNALPETVLAEYFPKARHLAINLGAFPAENFYLAASNGIFTLENRIPRHRLSWRAKILLFAFPTR
jgi:hypothetical protein